MVVRRRYAADGSVCVIHVIIAYHTGLLVARLVKLIFLIDFFIIKLVFIHFIFLLECKALDH